MVAYRGDSPHRLLEDWLQGLTVSVGHGAGQPLTLLPWQKKFTKNLLRDDVSVAGLSIGRAGGKSTYVAALACAALYGPLAIPDSESVVVAGSLEQSKAIQRHVERFLKHHPDWGDRNVWRVRRDYASSFIFVPTGASLQLRAPNEDTLQGLGPRLVLCDEPNSWGRRKTDDGADVFHALRSSLGKIPSGKLIALGVQASSDAHWFSRLLDGYGSDYVQLHCARPDDKPHLLSTWKRANPAISAFPHLVDEIRSEWEIAQVDSNEMARFRNKRLNLRVSQADDVFIDGDLWVSRCEGEAERTGPSIWGVDMGLNASASAIVSYWPATGAVAFVCALPRNPSLPEREVVDAAVGVYQQGQRDGDLILIGAEVVDAGALLAEAMRRFGRPSKIVADNFRANDVRQALESVRFPLAEFIVPPPGYKGATPRVAAFRAACAEGRVHAGDSAMMRHALAETVSVNDAHSNEMPGRRNRRSFNDPAIALWLAVSEGSKLKPTSKPTKRRRLALV